MEYSAESVTLELLAAGEITPAHQACGISPVRRLLIRNTSPLPLTDARIRLTVSPAVYEAYEVPAPPLNPGETWDVTPESLTARPTALTSVGASADGYIAAGVLRHGKVIGATEVPVRLSSRPAFPGRDENPLTAAAFAEPCHPFPARICARAGEIIGKTARHVAIDGYRTPDAAHIRGEIAALYAALGEAGITPISGSPGDPPRTPDEILHGMTATAMEYALLFCAAAEHAGLNPILVATEHTPLVGIWMRAHTFPECVVDEQRELTLRAAAGVDEICLTDPAMCRAAPFDTACRVAGETAAHPDAFLWALDIRRARFAGARPLSGKGGEPEQDAGIPYTETAHTPETGLTRAQRWERKLLDLTLRNPLIRFPVSRRGIRLLTPALPLLASLLSRGGEFSLLPPPKESAGKREEDDMSPDGGVSPDLLRAECMQGRIRTPLSQDDLQRSITGLYRTARTSREESGANPLYIACGFLRWYEGDRSEKPHHAPLLLLPAELVRRGTGYILRLREEEATFNVTLLAFLHREYDLNIAVPDPLPRGDWAITLQLLFNTVRRALLSHPKWSVEETAILANFSFNRFVLWNDLRTRADAIRENPAVAALLTGRADAFPPLPVPDDPDSAPDPAAVAAPLPYDASQYAAVSAAGHGASFVLHGPPGTGKSQTIVNMIANILYHDGTVLFVAAKSAALSVVERRLSDLGLTPACLPLYGDKLKRGTVIGQLRTLTEAAGAAHPAKFRETAERIARIRASLAHTVALLHAPRACGLSVADAIARYEQYRNAPKADVYTREAVSRLTGDAYRQAEDCVREYVAAAGACRGYESLLSLWNRETVTDADRDALLSGAEDFLRLTDLYDRNFSEIAALLPLDRVLSYDRVDALSELLTVLTGITVLPAGMITRPDLLGLEEKVSRFCVLSERRETIRRELLSRFDRELTEQDAAAALRDWRAATLSPILTRGGKMKRERNRLAVFAKDPSSLSREDVGAVWEAVDEYRQAGERMEALAPALTPLFGAHLRGAESDGKFLSRTYENACRIKRLAGAVAVGETARDALLSDLDRMISTGELLSHGVLFRTWLSVLSEIRAMEERIAAITGGATDTLRCVSDWPHTEATRLRGILSHPDLLRPYAILLAKRRAFREMGIGALADATERGEIGADDLLPAFRRNTCREIAAYLIEEEPELAAFSGAVTEQKIHDLADACRRFEDLTAQEIRARLASRAADALADPELGGEVTALNRAIRSGGRGISLRKLFDSIPRLLPRLCPCLMTDPLSCAQYLSAGAGADTVIFDEASQIPTCEAVGAISRAKHLIVVGDPRQLPPTSFFSAQPDEEHPEEEDLDSLLDDCLALAMPEAHLMWHYRSRSESLIAFSNRTYYENRLFTFPSPGERASAVSLIPVAGVYDRGRTKQNRAEAEAVVEEVVNRLSAPGSHATIGIVTFSAPQQGLIEDLLDERLSGSTRLQDAAGALAEPIFVKNLENVQGDERDVILFSVTYGAERNGRVSLNFGPLNNAGGWRRLNVAVTRAREEMLVFSSLKPEQIDLTRTGSEGARGLRAFLEYARGGVAPLRAGSAAEPDAPSLADALAADLGERGWTADTRVGSSRFRVDLAVRDPAREDTYLLGILTDGEPLGEESVRDRLLTRETQLTRLGWHLTRVWGIEYRDAPTQTVDRLDNLLRTLAANAAADGQPVGKTDKKTAGKTAGSTSAAPAAPVVTATRGTGGTDVGEADPGTRTSGAAEPGSTAGSRSDFRSFSPSGVPAAAEGTGQPGDAESAGRTQAGGAPEIHPVGERYLRRRGRVAKDAYRATALAPVPPEKRGGDGFFDPKNRETVLYQLREVLVRESPISFPLLSRRIASAWEIRLTGRATAYLKLLLSETTAREEDDNGVPFWWALGLDAREYATYRVPFLPADRRDPADIPTAEYAACIAHLTRGCGSLSEGEAIREAGRLFGYTRMTPQLEAGIRRGIDLAEREGEIIRRTERLLSRDIF